jgi:hypothetical protein
LVTTLDIEEPKFNLPYPDYFVKLFFSLFFLKQVPKNIVTFEVFSPCEIMKRVYFYDKPSFPISRSEPSPAPSHQGRGPHPALPLDGGGVGGGD